jgi:hypothetical protein
MSEREVRRRRRDEGGGGGQGGKRARQRVAAGYTDDHHHELASASLPPPVLAIASRNRKRHFFVPSVNNTFCGIQYAQVMIDSGCNSFLLPFPENPDDLTALEGEEYTWSISSPSVTGAISSPTLRIERLDDQPVGQMQLAFATIPVDMFFVRFHLGSESATSLVQHRKLVDVHKNSLQLFLDNLGTRISPERRHVLLGQMYLDQVCWIQNGPVMIMIPKIHNVPINMTDLCISCAAFAAPFVTTYSDDHGSKKL